MTLSPAEREELLRLVEAHRTAISGHKGRSVEIRAWTAVIAYVERLVAGAVPSRDALARALYETQPGGDRGYWMREADRVLAALASGGRDDAV